jgi:glycosyltransferase involved in cell wall biosynthesis
MIKEKIAFVTSAHSPYDDRIFYHLADSLSSQYEVLVVSSYSEVTMQSSNIRVESFNVGASKEKKIQTFANRLMEFLPAIVIASEPLPVLAANKYKQKSSKKVKIIYDITEWYPMLRNVEGLKGANTISTLVKMFLLNVYASFLCDGFIFGEYYKRLPYRVLFPFKKWKIISYYTNLKYISYVHKPIVSNSICLCYTGRISAEKGINNFIDAVNVLKNTNPQLQIKLKIIGWFNWQKDEIDFKNQLEKLHGVETVFFPKQDFVLFSKILQEVDIFFDLREASFENNYSLPIKLFYYAASGRPVIYSNLQSIKREVKEMNEFGFLVNPNDAGSIAQLILQYHQNPQLFNQHSLRARQLAEQKYNWQAIEASFLHYVSSFLTHLTHDRESKG